MEGITTVDAGSGVGLLDRERELGSIRTGLRDAHDGQGRVLLVLSGAGLGKTALLAHAAGLADEQGLRVLTARGSELERGVPFGVARQLFEGAVRGLEGPERDRVLSGAAEHARGLLGLSSEPAGGGDQLGVMHGLYWLVANLSDRTPLLLLIDDMHWGDSETARWVTYIATRVSDLPVLIIVATRPSEPGGEELVSATAGSPDRVTLTLEPLSSRSVGRLVSAQFGHAAGERFVDACHVAAGGNPFFVRELLRAAAADGIEPTDDQAAEIFHLGPREVARAILVRLARLGEPAGKFAKSVAVLGADAGLRLAAALSDIQIDDALGLWDVLERAEILQPGQPLEFIHPIARTSVYREIPAGERSRAHRRAAVILAGDGAEPSRIAVHATASEPAGDPEVVTWLRTAATQALSSGAPDAAARYLRRALAEPPAPEIRPNVHYELGHALVGTDSVAAAAVFSQAAAHAEPPLQVLAYRWAAAMLGLSGRLAEANAAFELAIALVGTDAELGLLLEATRDHYAVFWADDPMKVERRRRLEERAMSLDGNTAGERRVLAIASLSIAHTASAPASTCLELANRVRTRLPTWLDSDQGVETASGIGHSGIICDDPEGLARHERAGAMAAQRGWLINVGFGYFQQAMIRFRLGDLLDAESDARISWEILAQCRDPAPIHCLWSAAVLVQILIARGELDEAAELIEITGICREKFDGVIYPWPAVLAGELALAQGRTKDGIDMLLRAGAWLEACRFTNPAHIPWRAILAPALAAAGRVDEARAVIAPGLDRARYFGAPWALGMALRAAGTVEQGPNGIALLQEAIAVLELARCQLEHLQARLELGAALRRANQRAQARDNLRIALDMAHRCGAATLASRARQELAATGARPRRVMLTGVESLTASELRVAELAANGLSNPEIAQALFITRKTVETHLGHIYLKLDVGSRQQLPVALGVSATTE